MSTDSIDLDSLRNEVRTFVRRKLSHKAFEPMIDPWLLGWDESFSAELAGRGWVGMTIPKEYGGHGRSFLDRFVVTEELLAHGAPVAAHWIADRQIAPSLLRFGTEEQKQFFLPRIASGTYYFGIGMSEPDSGSDLASVRTSARQVDGGWTITGTKVWTSNGHKSHAFFALARTASVDPANRHAGLSSFIVDLHAPGITIRPIFTMGGRHHFNEVHLDNVFVPDDRVLGTIGNGWKQVTSELAFERSGPERFLSTYPLLVAALSSLAENSAAQLGATVARLAALRQLSRGVAIDLQAGRKADVSAAIVKLLGTQFEGDVVEDVALITDNDDQFGPPFKPLLHSGLVQRAGFTLRGGSTEVLKGVVARGLGLR